ncbi:Rrf2 family transcriptional regulator [Flavobacterium oreochromis]|uniref:Rrf2 family transcriptional regulator n=1 Tax=Flavobacterium oreochromis TaxID=2906078 RepID=UPI00385F6A7C
MKLNHFTDFSMRVLIYLIHLNKEESTSLDELASTFNLSRNHLIKVIQFLSHHHLIETKRGKGGGIRIAEKTLKTPIGNLIHLLEQDEDPIIDCNAKPCIFPSNECQLKHLFQKGYNTFIQTLNEYTLEDLRFKNWNNILIKQ